MNTALHNPNSPIVVTTLLTTDKPTLSFGIPNIDHIFPGFKQSDFAVLHGHQFCNILTFRLCVQCQLPQKKGGFNSSAIYIDGGNTFNPYEISTIAQEFGLDPKSTLQRVFVSRAFTAYQLSAIVLETLEEAIKQYKSKLILISDVTSLFLDQDVPTDEAFEIFNKMISHLSNIALRRTMIIATMRPNSEHSKRQTILESILLGKANIVARIAEPNGRLQLTIQNHNLNESFTIDTLRNEATLEKFVEK